MKKLFILTLILLVALSCSIEGETKENSHKGSILITVNRSEQQEEVHLTLTHDEDSSIEPLEYTFSETIQIDNLPSGEWKAYAEVFNAAGNLIKRGIGYVGVERFLISELYIPLAPVGRGQLDINIDFSGEIPDYVHIGAENQDDFNFEYTDLGELLPSSSSSYLAPVDLEAGKYVIATTVMKDGRIIGGSSDFVLIEDGSLTTLNTTTYNDSERAINNNSTFKFYIKSDVDGIFGVNLNAIYTIYNSQYVLNEAWDMNMVERERDKSCSYSIYYENGVRKLKLEILESVDPNRIGTYILSFGADDRGVFTFSNSNGSTMSGDFTFYNQPYYTFMEYFLSEYRYGLLDMNSKILTNYEGWFLHDIDVATGTHDFFSLPVPTTTPLDSDYPLVVIHDKTQISKDAVPVPDRSVTLTDMGISPAKIYRTEFNLNGKSGHITYHFYSKFKGVAEYALTDDSMMTTAVSVAPFSFSNYKDIPFNMYHGNGKEYRRTWMYEYSYYYDDGGTYMDLNAKLFYVHDTIGTPGPNGIVILVKNLTGLNTFSLDYSYNGLMGPFNPIFKDCDILGKKGNFILLKGKYHKSSANDLFLSHAYDDREPVLIQMDPLTMDIDIYSYDSTISDTFSNLTSDLAP